MALQNTVKDLKGLLEQISQDLLKAEAGNKAASQRVRTATVRLEKVAKLYRKESISSEKHGKGKKPAKKAAKPAVKKAAKPAAKKVAKPAAKQKKVVAKAKPKAKAKVSLAKPRALSVKKPTAKLLFRKVRA